MKPQDQIRINEANRPAVYLDQWVWIRLAQAAKGRPQNPKDKAVLEAVKSASKAGVAFPLSSTHFVETLRTSSHSRRSAVADMMASISHCRTLAPRRVIMRHQLLTAMHESFGRPMFRPERPQIIGLGVHWAFEGVQHQLSIRNPDGVPLPHVSLIPADILCRLTQWAEIQFLTGPADDQIELLRTKYGYRPEATEDVIKSRLEWEEVYKGLLADDPITREELRVRIQAREVIHEHLDLIQEVFHEYGVPFRTLTGGSHPTAGHNREAMVAFFNRMPTVRLAVARKLDLFRDSTSTWKVNDLQDIDAISQAAPYCDVVVGDKATVTSMRKEGLSGTLVTAKLSDLVSALPRLVGIAEKLGGDKSGWDWLSPGVGFDPTSPQKAFSALRASGVVGN